MRRVRPRLALLGEFHQLLTHATQRVGRLRKEQLACAGECTRLFLFVLLGDEVDDQFQLADLSSLSRDR